MEHQLRQIVDNSSAVIYVKDLRGRLQLVNRAFEQLFQLQAEEVLGRTDHELLPAPLADVLRANDRRVVLCGEALEFEEQLQVDGESHTYLSTKFPLFSSDGRPLGLIAAGRRGPMGAHDRERVESLLRIFSVRAAAEIERLEAEASYRAIFDSSEDAIFVHDLHSGALVDVNPKACQAYGYSYAEMLALQIDDFSAGYAPYTGQEAAAHLARAGAGEPQRFEWHRRNRDGSLHWDEVLLKRATIGGVAHDFNNLLTSMLGYTVMAQEQAEQLQHERLGKYLARVQRSAEKARDLIQQMLTFSRGSRGKPQAVVLSDFVKLVESTLPATVERDTQLARNLPPVLVDPVQLEQVLMNLCINARDAMGSVGQLRVSLGLEEHAAAVCASCQQGVHGRFVALTVSDKGPGIDPQVRAHMFEPFFSTKASGQGSGMGLSMVHGIVHEYGGHILLETAAGAGATFRILIPPLSQGADGVAQAVALRPQALQWRALQGRVAVVDDDPLVAEFMGELLEGWGLSARTFCDAEQACELLLADPCAWDFIILDQSMPRLSGLQLARRLLAARADLPIVLYTGFSDALAEVEVLEHGLKALLTKPLDQARLHGLLRSCLAGGAQPGGYTAETN